jgi:serine/threonine protein kinase/regulation of enolase protein 1 (concanavalin A-like superfamily)
MKDESSIFDAEPDNLDRLLSEIMGEPEGAEDSSAAATAGEVFEQPGGWIGRYKLLSVLGEGGMGVVYLAEQEEPIKRRVALKVIKPGMDSERVIARFEAEKQALALLDHANIARIFDAGKTELGRPYFVMEHVEGIPITDYCDQHKLTIEDRLSLFMQICQAVQHAHQKGIIHRDIKPSNILVSLQDDRAAPKIIDFGVAKALAQPLTERTLVTEQGRLFGTPEYMSPEQADMAREDIDTRSDVYSLGVLLYVLLTGVLPFDPETFRQGGIDHIRKVICEEDPKTPSMRLNHTSKGKSADLAQRRQTDMRTLQRKLHSDLDWITLKALEKDRDRRYVTVDALATDIGNYMNHRSVNAAPPGIRYRTGKFLRRHRQAMAITSLVLLLFSVLLWAGWAHVQARRERSRSQILEHERVLANVGRLFENRSMQIQDGAQPIGDMLAMLKPLLTDRDIGPQAELLSASVLVEDRRYDEAVPKLQDLCLLIDRPELAGTAHALLARIIWENQSLDTETLKKIERHQKKAAQLLPRTAEAHYLRAMTTLLVHQKLDLLTEALRLDPRHYPSRRLRALTYQASRKYRQLNEDALLLIYSRPRDPLGYTLRANALKELGNDHEAAKYYDSAIKLTPTKDPKYVELHGRRFESLIRMGRYERVIADAQECLRIEPNATIIHFYIFCALTALGQYEQASAQFRQALNCDTGARTKLRDWSMKYIFDVLEAGVRWHPPDSRPQGSAFRPMFLSEQIHRKLSAKARRLITDCSSGCWSPDSTRIAFSLGVHGNSGVAIYDLESKDTDLLFVPGRNPMWSPDNRHIAFVKDCTALRLTKLAIGERNITWRFSQNDELWVMNADGSEPRRLAKDAGWPCWNADAKQLYYHSRTHNMLYRADIDDTQVQPTPLFACSAYEPSVSPDETLVAYFQDGSLRITDLDSQSRIAEWTVPLPIWCGNWSPDAREFSIGGSIQVECRAGLWIYDLDKREARNVLDGQITEALWSSDRRHMLFSLGPPYFEIWVADLDPEISTAESLGPASTVDEYLHDWIKAATVQLEIDPNLFFMHWVRIAFALWIGDERASLYLQAFEQAIDREPSLISTCRFVTGNTLHRPEVVRRILPLTLLLVRKVAERNPADARSLILSLSHAGHREEAARLWQSYMANTPSGRSHYDRDSDTHAVWGIGTDIWNRSDDFHFTYTNLHGDGFILAKIDSIEHVHDWTKAGLMIRATLEPDSANAMLLMTPSGKMSFQYRRNASGISDLVFSPSRNIQLPHWIRLTRQGQSFTAQHSNDGSIWHDVLDDEGQLVCFEIPMDKTVTIGLAVSSCDGTKTAEARFSHVTITGNVSTTGPLTESQDICF